MLFEGLVAQLVEQCPFKALVQGSSPCQPTSLRPAQRGVSLPRCNAGVKLAYKLPTFAPMSPSYDSANGLWAAVSLRMLQMRLSRPVIGRADRGRHVVVQTILCADCKELYDAVIVFKPSAHREFHPKTTPKFAALLNRLPPRGVRHWIKWKPVCPVSSCHRIRLWKQPDKCPKCGTFLEPGAIPFRRWD